MCHTEADIGRCVEWFGIKDGNTIPTGLDLYRKMALESARRRRIVEDVFERSVLESSAVDVTGNPVIIEDWLALSQDKFRR